MLEAGVDIRAVMAVTGYKSLAMFQRYFHPTDSHLKTAVDTLAGQALVSNLGTVSRKAVGSARKSLKGL